MTTLDDLKQTFFDESNEGLEAIEVGLSEMRESTGTEDTVNAVFRGIHSIKGGAGVFGFDSLVDFSHVFETVLDAIRKGDLAVTPVVVEVLLKANDTLSDLVSMARTGSDVPAGYDRESRSALKQLLGTEDEDGGDLAPASFADIAFVPVRFDDDPLAPEAAIEQAFEIAIRPARDTLLEENAPLALIRALRACGTLELSAVPGALPALDELVPERAYLAWNGTLRTTSTLDVVRGVAEAVGADYVVEIAGMSGADAAPLVESPMLAPADPQVSAPEPTSSTAGVFKPAGADADEHPGDKKTAAAAASKAPTTTIRVDLERIDRVVNMVGELVIAQAMLGQLVEDLPVAVSGRLTQVLEDVFLHTRELKNSVMSMRAQPVRSVFQRMSRLVRELSIKTNKKIQLDMAGENTEVDKTIIERLSDPLTHIIRNSVDHGIEAPSERIRARKPEQGTIRLSADQRGGRIVIEISDDGAGINPERVLKKARERQLVAADAVLSDDEINNLIFLPGFSTAEAVSDISGRGVGMDVVRRNIQELGGRISLKSQFGKGMIIQLALPLTLAVMDGMIVEVGTETYVMPMSSIVECIRPGQADVRTLLGTRGALQLRGTIVPLVYLAELLEVAPSNRESTESTVIIIETSEGTRLGLVVDQLCNHQQVVIKSIEENYHSVPGIAAATILGNGRVAFILDAEKLVELANCPAPHAGSSGRGEVVPLAKAS
jgi:two-component system chemotaxis sensor kinase CheA